MARRNRTKAVARGGRVAALALSAGVLVTGLTGGLAASAEEPAEVRPMAMTCVQDDFGKGCFEDHGDHIIVEDFDSDGWRIEVRWETSYGRSGVCAIQSGKDYRHCNYDMAEGREIYFEAHRINEKFGLHEVIGGRYAEI